MKSSSNGVTLLAVISLYILILCMPKMSNADSSNNISIKFPFCVKDDDDEAAAANSSCQSPEFSLYQNDGLFLELANAGNFTVDDIIYSSREIKLSDPNGCLPLKLLSLDFDAITPFGIPVIQRKDFRVYNCSRVGQHEAYDVIGCVSGGSSYTVVSVEPGGADNVIDSDCKFLKNVSVPTSNNNGYDDLSSYSSIKLTWDEKNCESCGESMDSTGTDPTSNNNGTSSTSASNVKWVLIVGAMAILMITFRVCWIWQLPQSWGNSSEAPSTATTTNNTTPYTSPLHQTNHQVSGLNQSIMNSYPTVVIGKSGREIKPHDDNCPICLGEYVPGDTLKILPECIHRFHAECIDLWLSSNATCPVCRISPSHYNFSIA